MRWSFQEKKGPLESDFQWLGLKMNSGIKFEKSLGELCWFFSLNFWETILGSILDHLCGWWLCSLSISGASRGQAPQEKAPFVVPKWQVVCILHPYIYIYSTWLGLFKSSSLAHRPWGVRLVDSGEAKSFRSIKQTSTRKYSTNDPWRMMKLYLFHEISHGHQKWMLWNRASFLQLKQFWRVSGLWNKILVGFQEIVNFHYTGTTAQS